MELIITIQNPVFFFEVASCNLNSHNPLRTQRLLKILEGSNTQAQNLKKNIKDYFYTESRF